MYFIFFLLLWILSAPISVPCLGNNIQATELQPEFLAPLNNFTVTQGRDISFTCVVNDLGKYQVSANSAVYEINIFIFCISFNIRFYYLNLNLVREERRSYRIHFIVLLPCSVIILIRFLKKKVFLLLLF